MTSNISFCDRVVQNLVSEEIKQSILDKLLNIYNVSITQKDCVLLRSNYCNNLKKNDHVIVTKSNGNPYYLFLTKYNNVNTCFYIDKKVKEGFNLPRILIVKQRFDDNVFNDTLLEGELIRTKNHNWLFLFSNLYVYKGKNIVSNMVEKFNTIYHILTHEYYLDSDIDPCKFEVKKVFTFNQFNEMIDNFIPNLPYTVKGLIFLPINKKYNNLLYLYNRNNYNKKARKPNPNKSFVKTGITHTNKVNDIQDEITHFNESIKNNANNQKTIKFKIVNTETPDIFNLHLMNKNKHVLFGMAHVQTLKCSQFVKKIFKNKKESDIIVNCKYSNKFNKWEPISLSEDTSPDSFQELKNIL